MKRKLYLDELESFLADSAEEVRMYPSDRVWRNIDKELHGTTNWPALTFGAVLTGAFMLAALIFLRPDKDRFAVATYNSNTSAATTAKTSASVAATELANISYSNLHQNEKRATAIASNDSFDASIKSETVVDAGAENIADALVENPTNTETIMLAFNNTSNNNQVEEAEDVSLSQTAIVEMVQDEAGIEVITPSNNTVPAQLASFTKPGQELLGSPTHQAPQVKPTEKSSRWRMQYYAAPSLSYRLLRNEKISEKDNLPNGFVPAAAFTDVNTMVNHRNNIGFEAGLAVGYQLNDRVLVRAGLQFNYRSYEINAFRNDVAVPAVVRLSQNALADSLVSYTNISNKRGSEPLQITNRFLQISMPIGIEVAMMRFGKSQVLIGTSLQPTYNLNQNAWLLTSDYLQYVKEPVLMRNFNLNSAVEFFYRFQSKNGLQWQVGPQIRYQLLSTATNAYPVREHLIDYGIKFGVMKTLK